MTKTLQSQLTNPSTPLETEIAELGPWFHNHHLPDGTQTAPDHPLGDFPTFKWKQLSSFVPNNLRGWHVLDIGCNSGFYTFEFARRGARVTAIDVDPHYLRQARWAAQHMAPDADIIFEQMQVYDLAHRAEQYDLVWFMGVLYHLRYPMLALDIVARKARQMLVVQSLTRPGKTIDEQTRHLGSPDLPRMSKPGWPAMAFVEHELFADPTNWWLPNEAGLQAMLRSAGVEITANPAEGTYVCRPKTGEFAHAEELAAAAGLRPST